MRATCRILLAILTSLLVLVGGVCASPARADDEHSSWRIQNYEVDATFAKDGTAKVETTVDFDFGMDAGHGPYLVFVTRQAIEGDSEHWRMVDYSDVEVSSPSGAPSRVAIDEQDGVMTLKVGEQRRTVTGLQRYTINYTVHGLADPHNATSGLDEVNWTVVGDGFTVPINNATVSLSLPAEPKQVACYVAEREDCRTAQASGRTVTYNQVNLQPKSTMRVVAGMPVGSLVGAEPRLTERFDPVKAFLPTPVNAGLAGAVLVLGLLGLAGTVRRNARDEAYAGLTPGLTPTGGAPVAVQRAERRANVAVQFSPPAGTTPGEVGTLIDERADQRDVTATIFDLAVRGHIQVEQTKPDQWRFNRLQATDPTPLLPHEETVLSHLFSGGPQVTTTALSKKAYGDFFPEARKALYAQATKGRGWFRNSPEKVRTLWLAIGIAVAMLGAVVAVLGLAVKLALPGVAVIVLGLAIMACSNAMPARTADGSAVLAQARGFELYLRTAEADQLKFEEGEDIFSRYLPWAMMLGVADRWTKLFEKLAAEGRYDMEPSWYVGYPGYGYGYLWGSMASMGNAMSEAMASSQQAAAAASNASVGGGSGFSMGGGGFGGGGGGGW